MRLAAAAAVLATVLAAAALAAADRDAPPPAAARPPPGSAQPTVGVKSVKFFTKFADGSAEIPLDHPIVARAGSGSVPDQLLLKLAHNGSVLVSWSTGDPVVIVGNTTRASLPTAVPSVVQYGTRADDLAREATSVAPAAGYVQTYPDSSYASGAWHSVALDGLTPGTRYYYRAGDGRVWSDVASFVAPPRAGPTFPVRLAVIADVGHTWNSSSTLGHLLDVQPTAIILAGDASYADTHLADDSPRNRSAPRPPYQPSYQPRWDAWGRLVSRVFSHYPAAFVVGNHDVEKDATGARSQAFRARLATDHARGATPSDSPLWYSLDVGPVHLTMLDAYSDYAAGSPQHAWMLRDFAAVDRAVTPWLVVGWHPPFYHTYSEHFKEVECARQALEPALLGAGVDVFLSGHIHAFERTARMADYRSDACGVYHVTVGDSGNVDRQSLFVDANACPKKEKADECARALPGPFCPDEQPEWSLMREPGYGFAEIEFVSPTRAVFKWHHNLDGTRETVDSAELTRDPACLTKAAAPASTAAAPVAPTASSPAHAPAPARPSAPGGGASAAKSVQVGL